MSTLGLQTKWKYLVRLLQRQDCRAVAELIRQMNRLDKYPEKENRMVTEENLLTDGFGPRPWYHCMVAEGTTDNQEQQKMEIAGFNLYSLTWDPVGGKTAFCHKIFVRPEHRGQGIGKAMVYAEFMHATSEGCMQAYTLVYNSHLKSRQFQGSFGYVDLTNDVPESKRINFLELYGEGFRDTLEKGEEACEHIDIQIP